MSNPCSCPSTVPIVVPDGKVASDLTVGELDKISRDLKSDALQEIAGKGYQRYGALARVAHLWARRADLSAQLQTYLDLEPEDLFHALRMERSAPGEPSDPTTPSDSSSESSEPS